MGDDPKVTNTTKKTITEHGSKLFLMESMIMGGSNAIENQEARGQQELCQSSQLPIEGLKPEVAEKMGIKIIGPTKGDPLFTDVELPEGWEKKATEHSMHNNLVDDKGCIRAGIFYKAAFYDRKAHLYFRCRFTVERVYGEMPRAHVEKVAIKDNQEDKELKVFKIDPRLEDARHWEEEEDAVKEANEWIDKIYPDHKDPAAYWGEEVK